MKCDGSSRPDGVSGKRWTEQMTKDESDRIREVEVGMAALLERVQNQNNRLDNHAERVSDLEDSMTRIRISTAQMASVASFWKWAVPVVIAAVGVVVAILRYKGQS